MKRAYLLYAVLAVGVLAWWLAQRGTDDEARIRAQLDRVAELTAKEPGEKALEAADRARRLTDLFTESFEMRLDPVGVRVTSGPELTRPFVGLRRQAERLSVAFDVQELQVGEDFPTAQMEALARLSGKVEGRNRRESYLVRLAWKEERGEWRIESLHVIERVDG